MKQKIDIAQVYYTFYRTPESKYPAIVDNRYTVTVCITLLKPVLALSPSWVTLFHTLPGNFQPTDHFEIWPQYWKMVVLFVYEISDKLKTVYLRYCYKYTVYTFFWRSVYDIWERKKAPPNISIVYSAYNSVPLIFDNY